VLIFILGRGCPSPPPKYANGIDYIGYGENLSLVLITSTNIKKCSVEQFICMK